MAQFTVLTMNALGLPVPVPGLRRRLGALGRVLAASAADVVCLQEVGRWRHLTLLRQDDEAWPHAIAFAYPYAPKGGLVTLSRPTVVAPNYQAFKERGRPVGMHAAERFQGKGVLKTPILVGDQWVVILNTHLAANYSAQWSYINPYTKVERAQMREVAALVAAIPPETLVVVAGDFNVPRGSWLYHEFLAATGLHDPLAQSREPTYRPLPGMPARAAQALDHIFIRAPAGLAVQAQAELCFREQMLLAPGLTGYLSDHLGVRLTLSWPDKPADEGLDEPARNAQDARSSA